MDVVTFLTLLRYLDRPVNMAVMKRNFLSLYDEYYPKLYAYVLSRTRQREQAEDIVQQTFERALQNIDTFTPRRGATFGSWLFAIAKNEMVNGFRQSKKYVTEEAEKLDALAPAVDAVEELLQKEVDEEGRRVWRAIMQAMDILSDIEREVITLKYLADMSYADIGALTGKKPNTLAVILKRALEKIRAAISV